MPSDKFFYGQFDKYFMLYENFVKHKNFAKTKLQILNNATTMQPNNNRKTVDKNQQVKQAIKNNYDKNNQQLTLSKSSNGIWKLVLNSWNWSNLKGLNLDQCKIQDNEVTIITNKNWPHLMTLGLGINYITSIGLKALLMNPTFNQLQNLNLSQNNIGRKGVNFLVKLKLPNLNTIGLGNCNIGDSGAVSLSKADWKDLQSLIIWGNDVKISGFEAISQRSDWRQLNYLNAKMDIIQNQQSIGYLEFIVMNSRENKIVVNKPNNQGLNQNINNVLRTKFPQQL